MHDFDKRFNDHFSHIQEQQRKIGRAAVGIGAVSLLLSLGIIGAVVAVAWHFISKWW